MFNDQCANQAMKQVESDSFIATKISQNISWGSMDVSTAPLTLKVSCYKCVCVMFIYYKIYGMASTLARMWYQSSSDGLFDD